VAGTISWYEIDCDISKRTPITGGLSFFGRCEKGGGAKSSATINIKRINANSLNISVSGMDNSNDVYFACAKKSMR
jgi:hypothetical protein